MKGKILKLDFRNNLIQEFDFEKIPNTVKHLLLDGNEDLRVSEIPIKKLASHLHEFTLPKQFENQVDIHFSDIYSTAIKDSKWFEVDSDEKLAALIVDKEMVKHLKISIQPGSQLIETETLFNRLIITNSPLYLLNSVSSFSIEWTQEILPNRFSMYLILMLLKFY